MKKREDDRPPPVVRQGQIQQQVGGLRHAPCEAPGDEVFIVKYRRPRLTGGPVCRRGGNGTAIWRGGWEPRDLFTIFSGNQRLLLTPDHPEVNSPSPRQVRGSVIAP